MYTIFTKPNCVFCDQSKALLRAKGLPFKEVKIVTEASNDSTTILLEHFKAMYPLQRSAPLILQDGMAIGGFTELKAIVNATPNTLLG